MFRLLSTLIASASVLIAAVSPAPQTFPAVELNGHPAHTGGCGFLNTSVTDCGPYEYAPSDADRLRLTMHTDVTFTIADGWTFGPWTLRGIAEDDIPASLDPTVGQIDLDLGSGGGASFTAHLPAETGQWRLFLTYQGTRGSDSLNVDRPDVWLVDLRLPDSSTALLLGRALRDPAPVATWLVVLGFALLGVAARLARVGAICR